MRVLRLFESKADEQRLINYAGEELAKQFFSLKSRLKSPENDIYYWLKRPIDELRDRLNELQSSQTRGEKHKEAQKGAKLIYNKDGWKVYHITTYEASAEYGKNTQWCISGSKRWSNGERGKKYFNNYVGKGVKFYFYIKSNDEKFALALYSNGNYEVFNQTDDNITFDESLNDYNLPNVDGLPELYINFSKYETFYYDDTEIPDGIKPYIKRVIVKDGVTSIRQLAFYNCTKLTNITIPDSVKHIGYFAFYNCSNLENIYYKGIEEQFNSIDIGGWNGNLLDATWHYNSSTNESIIESLSMDESIVEIHRELNPVLWESNKLKPEIREKIFDLIAEFEDNLEIPLNILDIELVGSNASYNYTDKSDVDVHIITDFSTYGYPEELVSAAMNAFKTNFNKSYDIDYRGYNVEIYVEDINSQPVSNGIYSVLRDEWIKEPSPLEPIEVDLEPELSEYRRRIDDALKDGNREDIQAIIDELYILRRNSVAAEGEFGKGNLIFKQIRNDGLLDGLKNKKTNIKSKELSLEGLLESLSLLEKFEPKLYRADFVYDDNGAVKKDYAFVIQPKSTITVTKENAFSTDVIGAKNMERFKGCKIVRFAETTKNDVLKNPDKLVTKINRELRRDTRKSVQDWVSSGEVVDVAGNPVNLKPKEYATHHRNGNELITSDKKFITVIPRMGSKRKENMVHGILEIMDAENTDVLRFPVYFSDDARDKLKEHTVEVRLV